MPHLAGYWMGFRSPCARQTMNCVLLQWRCHSSPQTNKAFILLVPAHAWLGPLGQNPCCLNKTESFTHNKRKSNQTHNYAIETLHFNYFACLPLVKILLKWAIFRSSYFAQQSVLPSSSWKSKRWSRKQKDNAEGISKHCRRVREISYLIYFFIDNCLWLKRVGRKH